MIFWVTKHKYKIAFSEKFRAPGNCCKKIFGIGQSIPKLQDFEFSILMKNVRKLPKSYLHMFLLKPLKLDGNILMSNKYSMPM